MSHLEWTFSSFLGRGIIILFCKYMFLIRKKKSSLGLEAFIYLFCLCLFFWDLNKVYSRCHMLKLLAEDQTMVTVKNQNNIMKRRFPAILMEYLLKSLLMLYTVKESYAILVLFKKLTLGDFLPWW